MSDAINPDVTSLGRDIERVLVECRSSGLGVGVFRTDVSHAELSALAAIMARRLAPLIGGRYIPKREMRADRDDAVSKAFNGHNHNDLMREFDISRRLVYMILSRKRGVTKDSQRNPGVQMGVQKYINGRET